MAAWTKWAVNCSIRHQTQYVVAQEKPTVCAFAGHTDTPESVYAELTSDGLPILDDTTGTEYRIRVRAGVVVTEVP